MKKIVKFISLSLMIMTGACILQQKASAQGGSVSFQVFYDELSPYGTWVENPEYGYVWFPEVAPGFSPYATNGYWVFTDEGWTWVSNYPWGWAPFHYGRWFNDPMYGPMWVPDNEWGPGWVTWRRSRSYYGWAPVGPGVSMNIAYSSGYNVPYNQWTFVRGKDFGRTNINNYYVNNSNNVTIINQTTVINNTRVDNSRNVTYNAGPDRTEVEKHLGRTVTPIAIKESSRPGQNVSKEQLEIYRPPVQKSVSTGPKPAPSKVANLKEVKTIKQRKADTPSQKVNHPAKQQTVQPQQARPAKKTENVKQAPMAKPTQQAKPAKKAESVKQTPQAKPPQQAKPAKKTESVKQEPQAKPPQQASPSKKTEGIKQTQHTTQPDKQKHSKQKNNAKPSQQQPSQPQKDNPPQKTDEETIPQ